MIDFRKLHGDSLVLDSHNDTIVAHIRRGNLSLLGGEPLHERYEGVISFLRGRQPAPRGDSVQIDFAKMRKGGINAAFFAIDVTVAFQNRLAYALDGFGYLMNDAMRSREDIAIVKRAEDILRAKSDGKPAVIMAVEHADCTVRSLNVLRMLYELGVRSIGLTHNISSWAADGCLEAREGVGLTSYGVRLIREMNELGMLVDLAHVSPSAFFDALEVSKKPVIFSHGNARMLCDHPRNLTDDQLKALAGRGGVIGMSYVPDFIDKEKPTLERLLDHIDHAVAVAGVDTVGLGSDFDGGGTLLTDATEVPRITEGLARRGYGEEEIRKILGGNLFRVLRETIG